MKNIESIKDKIEKIHNGDRRQLDVIYSSEKRIIVEAPAGYGKTATMVSRVAYLYSIGAIPNPKKVLALTFSVNAALKIKRDIAEKLPLLIGEKNNPVVVADKVTATNYHGFCKCVIKKYGKILTPLLCRDVNMFLAIDEYSLDKYDKLRSMDKSDCEFLISIGMKIKNSIMPETEEIEKYNRIVTKNLLPYDIITHTAILFYTIELFAKNKDVKSFYKSYYPLIVVDEFQDTNCISWKLITQLISDNSQILLLGDSLQRIYGFIGAVPDIMSKACIQLSAKKIVLTKNYRFKDNQEMLKLDSNIRANAEFKFSPNITDDAKLETLWALNQKSEANKVIAKINELNKSNNRGKTAILFRGRGENSEVFEEEFTKNNINFFYGMFTDEDEEYNDFHRFCQMEFIKRFSELKTIGKKSLDSYVKYIRQSYRKKNSKMSGSLLELLRAFIKKVAVDYSDLSAEDKYQLILDSFENKQLKQAMEYVEADIIFATIHGAKGLEWPYVFLVDFEKWGVPNYFTCKDCVNKFSTPIRAACPLPSSEAMDIEGMLDELSVFYVAITRAKKQVYVSASAKRANNKDGCLSCMSRLPGIVLNNADTRI